MEKYVEMVMSMSALDTLKNTTIGDVSRWHSASLIEDVGETT